MRFQLQNWCDTARNQPRDGDQNGVATGQSVGCKWPVTPRQGFFQLNLHFCLLARLKPQEVRVRGIGRNCKPVIDVGIYMRCKIRANNLSQLPTTGFHVCFFMSEPGIGAFGRATPYL